MVAARSAAKPVRQARPARTELQWTSRAPRRLAMRPSCSPDQTISATPLLVCTGCSRRLALVPLSFSTSIPRPSTAAASGPIGQATTGSTPAGRCLSSPSSERSAPLTVEVWLT
jgi:hypothetical protein